jgi:hypothetical protein
MPKRLSPKDARQREQALSRWEGEGGAEADGPQLSAMPAEAAGGAPFVGRSEWAELRTRVIALENLVIALLAATSDEQRARAREMAAFILPRPGATHHRLTVHAAHRMTDLIGRAERFETAED